MRKTIFHEDWWLDIVAPGRWSEVTAENGYLRYVVSTRMMFRSIRLPALTRTLGPVLQIDGKKNETRQRAQFTTVCALLDALPDADSFASGSIPPSPTCCPSRRAASRSSVQYTFWPTAVSRRRPSGPACATRRATSSGARKTICRLWRSTTERFARFYADNLDGDNPIST